MDIIAHGVDFECVGAVAHRSGIFQHVCSDLRVFAAIETVCIPGSFGYLGPGDCHHVDIRRGLELRRSQLDGHIRLFVR